MRKLGEPAVAALLLCASACAFLQPKTNVLCADVSLCLRRQLVRPVTIVPNVPGIPGPPSPQPQPAQSEAKLVLTISSFTSNIISLWSLSYPMITIKVMREPDNKRPFLDQMRALVTGWV